MEQEKKEVVKEKAPVYAEKITFWSTVYRGISALILGVALIFLPDKTSPLLFNFMGFFWMSTGFISLRHDPALPHHSKLSKVVALVIMLTGLGVVTRDFSDQWIEHSLLISILGVVIALTGLIHMFGGIEISKFSTPGRSKLSYIFGAFEIILGLMLIFSDKVEHRFVYGIATVWALVGAVLIFKEVWDQKKDLESKNEYINPKKTYHQIKTFFKRDKTDGSDK